MIVARGEAEIIGYMARVTYSNHNNSMLIDRELEIMNVKLCELEYKLMEQLDEASSNL